MMKKNIGILFSVSRKMGVFQYGLSIAEALINTSSDYNYTILYFENESPKEALKIKNKESVKYISLDASGNNIIGKAKLFLNCVLGRPIFSTNKKNGEIMKNIKLDLLIIPFQLMFGFEHKIPYIVAIPDIMYKFYPQFPEYSFKNRILNDFVFKYSTKYSRLNIVDSKLGAEHLNRFFGVKMEKIAPIPYLPAGYVYELKDINKTTAENMLGRYNLPKDFIFYPAQFWAHKNHIRLIKAISIVKEKYNEKINLVLVGNDKANSENYNNIMTLAKDLNIDSQVKHLGYVSDEEIVALYKTARALVFASVGGPTNIPIIEAMILGTPVVCPNLFAMPDQVGKAGVLFDAFNPDDMAEKIYKVWKDGNLRQNMIELGLKEAEKYNFENYAKMWVGAVKKAVENK